MADLRDIVTQAAAAVGQGDLARVAGLAEQLRVTAGQALTAAHAEPAETFTVAALAARWGCTRRQVLEEVNKPGGPPRIRISPKVTCFRRADILAFEERRVVAPPDILYSPLHARIGTPTAPQAARAHAGRPRGQARGHGQHGRPLGAGRSTDLRASGAPRAAAGVRATPTTEE